MSPAKRKNPAAVALGRRGGLVSSPAKRAAAQQNIQKRWAAVKKTVERMK